ncbi:MAG: MBL fold metallo-hydrolase [Nitrospinota bacterium]
MEQVSPHVYVDPADGPNTVCAIQTAEGVILVDSPHPVSRALRWAEEVKTLGEVRYLINTEYHADHIFGNAFLPGTILSHQHTKDMFWEDSDLGPNFLKDPKGFTEMFEPEGGHLVAGYRAREPEITFDGRLTLSLGELTVEAFPMPGHVPADTAVYVPADRVLFAGDNVFNDVMTWYHDSLPFAWLETLERFKAMDVEVVIPGHGKPAGPEVFDRMKGVVEDAIEAVRPAVESGMSREEAMDRITLIDRQPVPDCFRAIAPRIQRLFVGRIYDRILARRP